MKKVPQFVVWFALMFFVLLLIYNYSTVISSMTLPDPLVDDVMKPKEFVELAVVRTQLGLQIRGVFRKDGVEVRFVTLRGPRTPIYERIAGANSYEVDACFLNKDGHSLVQVSGGHAVMIPECQRFGGEPLLDNPPITTLEEMQLVREAMQAIVLLRFRPEYEPEQRTLTSALAMVLRGSEVSPDHTIVEHHGGEIVFGPGDMPPGGGISLP